TPGQRFPARSGIRKSRTCQTQARAHCLFRQFTRSLSGIQVRAAGETLYRAVGEAGKKSAAAVFAGTAPGRSGGGGAEGQSSALVKPSKSLRVAPSMVTQLSPKQSRNTPPSGVSNWKKFGRRIKFERSECFFSSASEYCPKKRAACSSLSRRTRVTRISFFVCFCS